MSRLAPRICLCFSVHTWASSNRLQILHRTALPKPKLLPYHPLKRSLSLNLLPLPPVILWLKLKYAVYGTDLRATSAQGPPTRNNSPLGAPFRSYTGTDPLAGAIATSMFGLSVPGHANEIFHSQNIAFDFNYYFLTDVLHLTIGSDSLVPGQLWFDSSHANTGAPRANFWMVKWKFVVHS
ncbi:hypothetical protein FB45DRAFT_875773 [Roridomyces roridus]|uniref:Uncharacterized protein n=1 Tax=Roridomyces roridus TaxID=1738132 RepID=A0AAD7FBG4_9AGAR|nr:hypothetical protein FB45DRAFT_875773 [Roridomyces roridus]